MSLLTASQAHDRGVGLALSEPTLQGVIDDEEAEMIRRYGAHGDGVTPVTEAAIWQGGSVYLRRAAVSVSAVTEAAYPGGTAVAIVATDRYSWLAQGRIQIYPAGVDYPASMQTHLFSVTYVPVDDRALRRQVLLELVGAAVDQLGATAGGRVSGLSFSAEATAGNTGDLTRTRAYRRLEFFST